MSRARQGVLLACGLRVAWNLAAIVSPARVTGRWLGRVAGEDAGKVALRGLLARDALIGAGTVAAARRGAPLRPWLLTGLCGDLTDVAASIAGRRGLPDGGTRFATLSAGGAGALTLALLFAVEE